MKKKNETNYLDKIPIHSDVIQLNTDENGIVTLEIENRGIMNRIAQTLFKKPKTSCIHLDELGSFVWLLIDGKKSVYDIAVLVEEHFAEKAQPLYERLVSYFGILENYNFISWVKR